MKSSTFRSLSTGPVVAFALGSTSHAQGGGRDGGAGGSGSGAGATGTSVAGKAMTQRQVFMHARDQVRALEQAMTRTRDPLKVQG